MLVKYMYINILLADYLLTILTEFACTHILTFVDNSCVSPYLLLRGHVCACTSLQTVTVNEVEEEQRSTLTSELVDSPPRKKKFMFICELHIHALLVCS